MAKVLVLNTQKPARHIFLHTPQGALKTVTIPGSNGVIPGSAVVDEDMLRQLVEVKKDRVVRSWFDDGILRLSNAPVADREDTTVVITPPMPIAPAEPVQAPAAPAVPPAPPADEVPEPSDNTPPDAPWATGNVK